MKVWVSNFLTCNAMQVSQNRLNFNLILAERVENIYEKQYVFYKINCQTKQCTFRCSLHVV